MSSTPDDPKQARDRIEGPEASAQFEHTMRRVLTVSKTELDKREAAYKKSRRAKKIRTDRAR